MTKAVEFMGEQGVLLENKYLRAVILPERGGKAASLFGKETGMEVLYQNAKGRYAQAEFGSDFGSFEACGYDDAFPNVDAETVELGGKTAAYPDHGEIWSAAFAAETEENGVRLFYRSRRLHYDYRKRFYLKEKRLCCDYVITNCGAAPLPCIWTMHCLVNLTPQMRFVFPDGTAQVQNVFAGEWLGEEERIYPFPEAEVQGRAYRFDRPPEGGMVKYYVVGPVREGVCGYDYPETNTAVRLRYDAEKLPYLGCWVTAGGYRGEKNCALEPCTGYYDSVGKARRLTGACPVLQPGEELCFTMAIEVGRMQF